MSKTKKTYTEMNTYLKSYAKHQGISPIQFVNKFAEMSSEEIQQMFKGDLFRDEHLLTCLAFSMECNINDGNATHIFMPDEVFCNWLVSCVTELHTNQLHILAEDLGDAVGVLHFPTSSKLTSVSFHIIKDSIDAFTGLKKPNYSSMILTPSKSGNIDAQYLVVDTSENNNNIDFDDEFMWYAKLIIGMGMYLSCFPEQKIIGVPNNLKHAKRYKNKSCKTINVSQKIVSKNHGSPIPHYRDGHFRILKSERFTKKRFTTIFVKGCFVKGKAQTVLTI